MCRKKPPVVALLIKHSHVTVSETADAMKTKARRHCRPTIRAPAIAGMTTRALCLVSPAAMHKVAITIRRGNRKMLSVFVRLAKTMYCSIANTRNINASMSGLALKECAHMVEKDMRVIRATILEVLLRPVRVKMRKLISKVSTKASILIIRMSGNTGPLILKSQANRAG